VSHDDFKEFEGARGKKIMGARALVEYYGAGGRGQQEQEQARRAGQSQLEKKDSGLVPASSLPDGIVKINQSSLQEKNVTNTDHANASSGGQAGGGGGGGKSAGKGLQSMGADYAAALGARKEGGPLTAHMGQDYADDGKAMPPGRLGGGKQMAGSQGMDDGKEAGSDYDDMGGGGGKGAMGKNALGGGAKMSEAGGKNDSSAMGNATGPMGKSNGALEPMNAANSSAGAAAK
jgi:hypothetical protein